MKRTALLLIMSMLVLAGKDQKTGFVDSERIFREYQATASADAEFSEFVRTYRDSAAVLKQNIEQLKADLEAQKLVLSEEARLRKLDEIETLNKAYNVFLETVYGKSGVIDQKNDALMMPLFKKINDAVAKISEQEGFTMVLDLSDGVFYASNELDLTDLVINELNLEYGPQTLPTGEIKKFMAIFPFKEENTEATDAALGEKLQNELYKTLSAFSQQYRIVGRNEVASEIVKRGYDGRNIEENQAYTIAHALTCDYIVIGTVSKYATRINYTIILKDVGAMSEIGKKSSNVTDDIKLSESLNNDFRALLEKLQGP